jgi:FKBP-type peptidyl-prolyl cis-trans isomerase
MRQALNSLSGILLDRRTLIVMAAVVTIAVVGCRGGGSNPSEADHELPRIDPTVSASECVNEAQPEDAPQFEDIDHSRFEALEDGLRFYDVVPGTGVKPELIDAVSVELTGWLEDGCMFDTSFTDPQPVILPLINLIPGWRQGIAAMNVGGTRVLEIAPELAFGAVGAPPGIPPNATLILYVELIGKITIEQAQATATAEAAGVQATSVAANCVNDSQPDVAPTFDDIDMSRFEPLVDGVRFYEIEPGTGVGPDLSEIVSVEYTGWLLDGCMFDSSYRDEGPIVFPLANVIPGWQQGLSAMKAGGTWVIEIVPDLAYGESGAPPSIPANATLIFHVNLIKIE